MKKRDLLELLVRRLFKLVSIFFVIDNTFLIPYNYSSQLRKEVSTMFAVKYFTEMDSTGPESTSTVGNESGQTDFD